MANHTKLTPEKEAEFCEKLAESGIVAKACKAVGIARVTAYKHKKENAAFAARWAEALEIGITALEDEAHRRAFEGIDKPLVYQGQFTPLFEPAKDEHGNLIMEEVAEGVTRPKYVPVIGADGRQQIATMKEYSDTLAIFLLKAHNPDKYRENAKVQITGPNDGPIEVEHKATALAEIFAKAKARKDSDISDLV